MKKELKQQLKDIIFPNNFRSVALSYTDSRGRFMEILIQQNRYSSGYNWIKGYVNKNEEEIIVDYYKDSELSYIYDSIGMIRGDYQINGEVDYWKIDEKTGKYTW